MELDAVTLAGELKELVDAGKLVPVAFIFYDPKKEGIQFYFPTAITRQEALAILQGFGCYPFPAD